MAEPYSDQELAEGISWGPTQGLYVLAETAERINATVTRLRDERDAAIRSAKGEHAARVTAERERDDAQRVARIVATASRAWFEGVRDRVQQRAWKEAEAIALAYVERR